MKLNRAKLLAAVNQTLAARASSVRVRFNSEYQEFQVCYDLETGGRTFAPCSSLTDVIYTAIDISSHR